MWCSLGSVNKRNVCTDQFLGLHLDTSKRLLLQTNVVVASSIAATDRLRRLCSTRCHSIVNSRLLYVAPFSHHVPSQQLRIEWVHGGGFRIVLGAYTHIQPQQLFGRFLGSSFASIRQKMGDTFSIVSRHTRSPHMQLLFVLSAVTFPAWRIWRR